MTAAASSLPKGRLGKDSCDRGLDPRPDFVRYEYTKPLPYETATKAGNVEIAAASEASAPERITEHPSFALKRFALEPGWLIRGLWVTGPQGPLGTNRFEVGSHYAYETYKGVEKDPAKRLRKILDIGLRMRYALLFRVTTYNDGATNATGGIRTAVVRADVFLADLEKGDIPCRLTATGRPYYVEGYWYSGTPHEDMQTRFGLDIDDKLTALTRAAERKG